MLGLKSTTMAEGLAPRLDQAAEQEIGRRSRGLGHGEVVGRATRAGLDHLGDDADLDQAVAQAGDLASSRLARDRVDRQPPAQARGVGEPERLASQGRLDRRHQGEHAEEAERASSTGAAVPSAGSSSVGSGRLAPAIVGQQVEVDRRQVGDDHRGG